MLDVETMRTRTRPPSLEQRAQAALVDRTAHPDTVGRGACETEASPRRGRTSGTTRAFVASALLGVFLVGCDRKDQAPSVNSAAPATSAPTSQTIRPAEKVELHEKAMGTAVTIVAYTNAKVDVAGAKKAMSDAVDEIRRLEALMSTYQEDSELSRMNRSTGEFFKVSPDTLKVIDKGLWAGDISGGSFDITHYTLGDLWKFGTERDENPKPPPKSVVERRKNDVDYRQIVVDRKGSRVKVPEGKQIGLGGIAKGYAVDRAADVLRKAGLDSFLVQAGGDLYGAGRKPDGKNWVSGIQDPRGAKGKYFATLPLEDKAFSTAGDYARAYVHEGRRYHHIIDPKTGFPATESRSVTIWADDAFVADAIDDAVFILGPEKGLELVERMDGVGAVIVDKNNEVHVSKRLQGKVKILHSPTDGV